MPKYLIIGPSGTPVEETSISISTGAGSAQKIIETGVNGTIDSSFLPSGLLLPRTVPASEALSAGNLINLHNNASVLNCRKAENTTGLTKAADGFVLAAVASGANATVYFSGIISGLAGLTIGSYYYLGASGALSLAIPTTANSLIQFIGKALSTTELFYCPQLIATRG